MARTHIQRVATQPKADAKPQNVGTKGGPRILYPRAFTIAISALSQDGSEPEKVDHSKLGGVSSAMKRDTGPSTVKLGPGTGFATGANGWAMVSKQDVGVAEFLENIVK
ncbi:hypothetical protein SeLEV6574_g08496 [Synchytrium endobioticum]|uniref:Uncharacterized protein n=1 Tax=Synchytrium endobioticum TaxID=286115 RepID=A0A507BYT1_9FUNG|nr:hypothetical protein SeLEV6574_g08496 [Synchytrium endobioticum]